MNKAADSPTRRITYTREMISFLSETKKLNGGRVRAAFIAAESDERFSGMRPSDMVDLAERCDEILEHW